MLRGNGFAPRIKLSLGLSHKLAPSRRYQLRNTVIAILPTLISSRFCMGEHDPLQKSLNGFTGDFPPDVARCQCAYFDVEVLPSDHAADQLSILACFSSGVSFGAGSCGGTCLAEPYKVQIVV